MTDLALPVIVMRDQTRSARPFVCDAAAQLTGTVDLHGNPAIVTEA